LLLSRPDAATGAQPLAWESSRKSLSPLYPDRQGGKKPGEFPEVVFLQLAVGTLLLIP